MKVKDLEFNNQLEMYKIIQISKYKDFCIDKDIFEKTFDEAIKKSKEESEFVVEHDKIIQKYIVNEINNNNVKMMDKVINYFSPIKTIIVKNQRYNLPKDDINKIYYKAIKLLKYLYNDNVSINMNILNNMKYIINNNYIETPINKMDIRIYDITFLREYVKYMKIDLNKLADELDINPKELSLLLNGVRNASLDLMDTLCIYFDVDSYEELLKKIKNELNNIKNIDYDKIRKKLLSDGVTINKDKKDFILRREEKYYNLSFMKEYVSLYNINRTKLCELFYCGVNKIDDVLDGKIWMKETLMTDLYVEFKVKNFLEFKAKILSMIKFSKSNAIKNKLSIFYKKYNNLKIKNQSLIDMIDKELLSQILDIDNMDNIDRNITKLLFKIGFSDDYTYDDISKILDVSKQQITRVHKEDLQKINLLLNDFENPNTQILKK